MAQALRILASQKGKDLIAHEGFIYNKKRANRNGTIVWECQQRRRAACNVQIKTQNGNMIAPPGHAHSHDPEPATEQDIEFRREILQAANERPETNPSALINEFALRYL